MMKMTMVIVDVLLGSAVLILAPFAWLMRDGMGQVPLIRPESSRLPGFS